MKKSILLCIALLVGAFVSGCTDSAPSGPPPPGLGGVSVKKYVSIGNSLTAGYQSNGLYASAQVYSYPNMIAQQLVKSGAALGTFEQPFYSDPGIPDPLTGKAQRYEIISFANPNKPVIGPRGLAPGAPTNSGVLRPYDNLGIPGIVTAHFLDTTNAGALANALIPLVLRYGAGSPFPKSVYKHVQALAANPATTPDIVTFWLGNNYVLGFASSGGAKPTAPESSATFAFLYKQALDSLRKTLPNAKIIVATIPDVKTLPFFTTLGPKIAAAIGGAYFKYQHHGGAGALSVDSTNFKETSPPLITLKGSAYVDFIGRPTFQAWRDLGVTYAQLQPTGLDSTAPFGLSVKNPWPDAYVLDPSEQASATQATADFNASIQSAAAVDNAMVFDAFAFFNSVKASGYSIAGEKYTADYISGGLFSLDGVHPSSRGYAVVANQFIGVMNSKFGTSIPFVDISKIPGIPMPLGKYAAGSKIVPSISLEAWKSFDALWGSGF